MRDGEGWLGIGGKAGGEMFEQTLRRGLGYIMGVGSKAEEGCLAEGSR